MVKRAKFTRCNYKRHTLCLYLQGTHGKTTSANLGHLLAACNMPVTAFWEPKITNQTLSVRCQNYRRGSRQI
jgi:UDP-N-acetylmuramate-alanine ligase